MKLTRQEHFLAGDPFTLKDPNILYSFIVNDNLDKKGLGTLKKCIKNDNWTQGEILDWYNIISFHNDIIECDTFSFYVFDTIFEKERDLSKIKAHMTQSIEPLSFNKWAEEVLLNP
jgi:hypothetical protein